MTTFFADLRIYRQSDQHYNTYSVEVPAPDLVTAVQQLLAFKAGLAVHPNFETASEESLYGTKRRGVTYLTMRETAQAAQRDLL